ncbi:MAG: methylenetetrahydrofolate reductase [NAD(P)H] [Pyramidobacter sp.]|nr:methylenetetrahydrofolate reductase [NAD(P)H] [Pyramidobacter sp.]
MDVFSQSSPSFTFEIFPPKGTGSLEGIFATVDALASLEPDLISVTYGAGGSSRENTIEIASSIQNRYALTSVAHLTCVGSSREEIDRILSELERSGVRNVLALRGDRRADSDFKDGCFKHASDLAAYIKKNCSFRVFGACYPEKHPEAPSLEEDICRLKEKVDSGVDCLISQLFLDNDIFCSFRDKAAAAGIDVPIIAGIMPITAPAQLDRIVSMCGASIPSAVRRFVNAYGHNSLALKEAGIAYATEQIIDLLASGVDGIHIYSMNQAEVTRRIAENMRGILYSRRVKKS